MKTEKRGIYLKLNESPFVYEKFGFKFYFSSEFYMNKFKQGLREFIDNENMKLEIRYKNPLNAQLYFMLVYYKRIEKRGYRIIFNNKEFTTPPVFQAVI